MNYCIRYIVPLTVLSLIGFTGCDLSKGDQEDTELLILDALEEQRSSWNRGNIEGFVSHYQNSEELTFVTQNGMVQGYVSLLDRYKKAYPDEETMGELQFEILSFKTLGDNHAAVVGKWTLVRSPDNPKGYFTLVWENTPEGWKIVMDHTS